VGLRLVDSYYNMDNTQLKHASNKVHSTSVNNSTAAENVLKQYSCDNGFICLTE